MDQNEYKIIGSGGFGLIAEGKKGEVTKFLYSGTCNDAEIEFYKHSKIYKSFMKHRKKFKQLHIAKPISFTNKPINVFDNTYACSYKMDKLENLDSFLNAKGLIHIINDDYSFDRVVGRNYNEKVSDTNPSRGFFANYQYITKEILPTLSSSFKKELVSIDAILEYIGFACGIIFFDAEVFPRDVEYTLGQNENGLCISVLDFGMTYDVDFKPDVLPPQIDKKLASIVNQMVSDILDIDIYFPTTYEQKRDFLKGFEEALLSNLQHEKDITKLNNKYHIYNAIEKKYLEE
jgi:hypothetical protein